MEMGYISERYNTRIFLVAIFLVGIIGYQFSYYSYAVLCPVDDISQHAETIYENIHNFRYDEAKTEAQKLINLVNQLEEDKINEDKSNLNIYQ